MFELAAAFDSTETGALRLSQIMSMLRAQLPQGFRMKFAFEAGDREKHQILFQRNWFTREVVIFVDYIILSSSPCVLRSDGGPMLPTNQFPANSNYPLKAKIIEEAASYKRVQGIYMRHTRQRGKDRMPDMNRL